MTRMARARRFALASCLALQGACIDPPSSPRRTCEGPECPTACKEGDIACHPGERAARCVGGTWIEQACEVACFEGRCVDCFEGERRCADSSTAQLCASGAFVAADCGAGGCAGGECACPDFPYRCGASGRQRCAGSDVWEANPCPVDLPVCKEGECLRCEPGRAECASASTSRRCRDDGLAQTTVVCRDGCDSATGACAVTCEPQTLRCHDDRTVERCIATGNGYEPSATCDVTAGQRCVEGECIQTCVEAAEQLSPSGCLFHAPPIYSLEAGASAGKSEEGPPTALYLINPDDTYPADVTVRQGGVELAALRIRAGRSQTVLVPGRTVAPIESHRIEGGAVVVESNRPIVAILHFDYDGGGVENPQSGDAAYLLPTHIVAQYGREYRVMTQPVCTPHWPLPGGFTVVATASEPTLLHMELTARTAAALGGNPGMLGPGAADVTLQHGDVIHFRAGCPHCPFEYQDGSDLRGSLLQSDRPVAVFNGGVSRVPCDGGHIQTQLLEQLMPVGLWGGGEGDGFVVSARSIPGSLGPGDEQWVVMTHAGSNRLVFDPPLSTSPAALSSPGSWFSFNSVSGYRAFRLETSAPALLARYFYSATSRGGSTFAVERPVSFWRRRYDIAAMGQAANRVLLVVPNGEPVLLDGSPLSAPRRAGPPGHELVEVGVERGTHRLAASAKFGLFVYGHGVSGPSPQNCYSYTGPVGFGDL